MENGLFIFLVYDTIVKQKCEEENPLKLYKNLESYPEKDIYPMHMPGHKRNPIFTMKNPYQIDITEIDGFDDLQHPSGVLREGMQRAAAIYGAEQSYYLVNGSSVGILAGIFAAVLPGETICIARNCHKSVYHALFLRGLKVVYLYPKFEEEKGFYQGITADQVEEVLDEHPEIRLFVLTSPTYEGVVSDIFKIAEVVHKNNARLFVDEAHGAHFYFSNEFPKGAIKLGADFVVHSIHKTLPSFTQTALLHYTGDLDTKNKISTYLNMFQSTSPSYLLLSGIEQCLDFLQTSCLAFEDFIQELSWFYEKTSLLKYITAVNLPWKTKDPSKLILDIRKTGMTGKAVYDILLEDYKIQPEMAAESYVLCMTSVCDTKEGFTRLLHALLDLDCKLESCGTEKIQKIARPPCRQKKRYESWQVEKMAKEKVLLQKSEGRASKEFLYLYPPGIPLLVPGEVISGELIAYLTNQCNQALPIQGLISQNREEIYVLIEE